MTQDSKSNLFFEVGNDLWSAASNEEDKKRAAQYLVLACNLEHSAAYLRVYEIISSELPGANWALGSYYFSHQSDYYLEQAMRLGSTDAFMTAFSVTDSPSSICRDAERSIEEPSQYSRLGFLAIAVALTEKTDTSAAKSLKLMFAKESSSFPFDFVAELLLNARAWSVGDSPFLTSELNGTFRHPNCMLYPPKEFKHIDLDTYCNRLPFHAEYLSLEQAYAEEEIADDMKAMRNLAKDGSAEAAYFCHENSFHESHYHSKFNWLYVAATLGHPDAIYDLISKALSHDELESFTCSKDDSDPRICFIIYLYTVMEQLGISHYATTNEFNGIEISCLALCDRSVNGLNEYSIDLHELKYKRVWRDCVAKIEHVANMWEPGEDFHRYFFDYAQAIGIRLFK